MTDTTATRTDINLDSAIAYAAADLARTDTKAASLLTLDGLLVAALSLGATDVHGLALVLAVTGAVALIAGVVLAVLVIKPRLTSKGTTDRASYVYYASADPAAIADALAADRRPARLQALSRIALAKMRMLSAACSVSVVATVTIAAALLTR
ncbi:Pycsar system effector family protein [Streptomyces sp. NPDC087307]|uniref:Pycsar system effector family protein n=1 Tax=Streptomyces sp. NPDC087307 TaxID=3365782 RepID=UPI003807E16A